jgi:hypothetical protein
MSHVCQPKFLAEQRFWGLHDFLQGVCIWRLMAFKWPQIHDLEGEATLAIRPNINFLSSILTLTKSSLLSS